ALDRVDAEEGGVGLEHDRVEGPGQEGEVLLAVQLDAIVVAGLADVKVGGDVVLVEGGAQLRLGDAEAGGGPGVEGSRRADDCILEGLAEEGRADEARAAEVI